MQQCVQQVSLAWAASAPAPSFLHPFLPHAMPKTKTEKGKQQRLSFVRQVAPEVSALQAADRRKVADQKATRRKEQTGPGVIVSFDPGPPPLNHLTVMRVG